MQRFTPRKPKSNWSAVNIKKVAELTARGLMTPAGLAALDPQREAMFRAAVSAWGFFSRQPPSYRQTSIYWVMNAKREETRSSRLTRLIDASAQERRL